MTCPQCGTENPGTNRFCMKCGAELATPAAEEAGSTAGPAQTTYAGASSFGSSPATSMNWQATSPAGSTGMAYAPSQLVGFGTRFVATLIDGLVLLVAWVVVFILAAILGAIHLGALGGLLIFVLWVGAIVYSPYFWVTRNGQTPGKQAMHIRVVRTDGQPLTVGTAVVRTIGYAVSSFIFYIGYLWVLWDPMKQGWHDKIASTYVVRAE